MLIQLLLAFRIAHGIKLNENKTFLIFFGNVTSFKINHIHLNNKPLLAAKECKDRGLTINSNLRFSAHVSTDSKNLIQALTASLG